MKERWNIPEALQIVVRARDKKCVYCGVKLTERSATTDRKTNGTWEHINNARWSDQSIISDNVVRCCDSCNSSKGTKSLKQWFVSRYCMDRGIDHNSVADIVKEFLKKFPD